MGYLCFWKRLVLLFPCNDTAVLVICQQGRLRDAFYFRLKGHADQTTGATDRKHLCAWAVLYMNAQNQHHSLRMCIFLVNDEPNESVCK